MKHILSILTFILLNVAIPAPAQTSTSAVIHDYLLASPQSSLNNFVLERNTFLECYKFLRTTQRTFGKETALVSADDQCIFNAIKLHGVRTILITSPQYVIFCQEGRMVSCLNYKNFAQSFFLEGKTLIIPQKNVMEDALSIAALLKEVHEYNRL